MPQLTEKQHNLLLQLACTDEPQRSIASRAGVSQGTVINFRRACIDVDVMSEELREKIRRLLLLKTPIAQISARLSIPGSSVRSLRRLDRFRKSGGEKCPECGTLIFSATETGPQDEGPEPEHIEISPDNASLLYRIVNDLRRLGELCIISNPLFHNLSQRAGKAHEKIHKETRNKTKSSQRAGGGVNQGDEPTKVD